MTPNTPRTVYIIPIVLAALVLLGAVAFLLKMCSDPGPPTPQATLAPMPAPTCVYDRQLLAKVSAELVEAGYEGRIAALVDGYGTTIIDCQLELVLAAVTAGMSSGAAALTPIEAHAKAVLAAHKKGP